jgi:hypothetical protein
MEPITGATVSHRAIVTIIDVMYPKGPNPHVDVHDASEEHQHPGADEEGRPCGQDPEEITHTCLRLRFPLARFRSQWRWARRSGQCPVAVSMLIAITGQVLISPRRPDMVS